MNIIIIGTGKIKIKIKNISKIARYTAISSSLLIGLVTGSAQAASISYSLNQTNIGLSEQDYLSVTISDSTTTIGDIDFSVTVNTDNYPGSLSNFGMDNFYFNYDNSLTVNAENIADIDPSSWSVKTDKNAGGDFGFFEFDLKGSGSTRTELLTFSITGVSGDSINSYALGYEGSAGLAYFAAHVAGFDAGSGITSGKFATFADPVVVPVPAAVWLFGSGLIGLAGFARKRA